MRILMTAALAFCVGTLLALLPVPGIPVAVALILGGLLTAVLGRKRFLRCVLILTGVGLGILWSGAHMPTETAGKYAGEMVYLSAEAVDYSWETTWGSSVEADLTVGNDRVRGIVFLKEQMALKPGDRFTVTAELLDSYEYTGNFYYRSEGIWLVARAKEEADYALCAQSPGKYWPKRVAHRLEQVLLAALPEDVSGYAVALTLGNRDYLTAGDMSALKLSGGYHLIALSGMHMTVLVGILGLLLRKKRLYRLLGIPVCIVFTLITGGSHSVVRACVMECFLLLGPLLNRESDWPTSLSLAAAGLMAVNPWCVFGWGTQLSFLSVIGLELLGDRFYKMLTPGKAKNKVLRKLRSFCAASLSASLAVTVTAVPLLGYYSGYVSLLYPLTALLLSAVVSICFGLGIVTALMGLVVPKLAEGLGWCLAWGFRYVRLISGAISRVPLTVIATDTVYGLCCLLILYAVLVILVRWPKSRKVIPLCCCLTGYGVCMLLLLLEGAKPGFTAVDVGQGQSLLLRSAGETVMVDCGGNESNAGDLAALELMQMGETRIDLLILTHFDSDHVNGVTELMERIPVERMVVPEQSHENREMIEKTAFSHGVEVYHCGEDMNITLGRGMIQILSTGDETESNNGGLWVFASMEEMEILITGDVDQKTENTMVQRYQFPKTDILVAGHHGSKTSTGQNLLEAVRPEHVVISVGDNSYGHPSEETLERIMDIGADILRTDERGSVTIRGGAQWQSKSGKNPALTAIR